MKLNNEQKLRILQHNSQATVMIVLKIFKLLVKKTHRTNKINVRVLNLLLYAYNLAINTTADALILQKYIDLLIIKNL